MKDEEHIHELATADGTLVKEILDLDGNVVERCSCNPESCKRCKRKKVDGKCTACGRPPDYCDEILDKVIEYVETKAWKTKYDRRVPSLANLSKYLDVSRDTIQVWKKEHSQFSYIVDKVEAEQEDILIDGGLSNELNSNITKLLLAKQGYTDKVETDITSKGEQVQGLAVSFVEPKKD